MKPFIKTVFAVVCGIFLAWIIVIILGAGFISALSSGQSEPVIPKQGVLFMDMSQINITEQSGEPDIMALLQGGNEVSNIGILKATQALNIAAADPGVKYLFIKADGTEGGIASLQEFRKAVKNFKDNGKAVISYIESPSTAAYYLASVADKVYMTKHQGGSSMVVGIGSQLIFLKDLLDMLGVNVQLIRHGKYKSAGEMYIKNSPSPENYEQNKVMIDAVWASYAKEIAESRDMSVERVNQAIDNLELNLPEDFLNAGFVDELFDREELRSKLADLAVVSSYKEIGFIDFADYVEVKTMNNAKSSSKIAIIYADGEIVDGSGHQDVTGDRFARIIAKVREDKNVKAVVFRVNSPGGSVLASEKIKAEIERLRESVPVIASYGNYAASGGYWISNSCDKIYADAATLTGSIGVFSMVPEFSNTLKKIAHINITTVGSNKHSDMYSLMRPFDQAETDYMQASVETIYSRFVSTVSEGRGLEPDFVDSIAQGRVWAGTDALKIGLIDELGTLEDALIYTAGVAGNPDLNSWKIVEYPKPATSMEMFMEMFGTTTDTENIFSGTPFGDAASAFMGWYKGLEKNPANTVFARIPYAIDIK